MGGQLNSHAHQDVQSLPMMLGLTNNSLPGQSRPGGAYSLFGSVITLVWV